MNVFPSNADGSELLAVTESVRGTYRMDTNTLATKSQEKFTDNIKGDLNTAHPKLLPNGDTVNIVVGFGEQAFYLQHAAATGSFLHRIAIYFINLLCFGLSCYIPPWCQTSFQLA